MNACQCLTQARQARGQTLDDIRRETRIPLAALEAIDAGHFSELPPGIYARAWVRAYASAVGLDPGLVVASVEPLLPSVADSMATIARLHRSMRVDRWRYYAAALVDAFCVLGLNALILGLSAFVSDQSAAHILRIAPAPMLVVFLVTLVLYMGLLAGTGGRTAGPALFGVDMLPRPSSALTLREIGRRAAYYLSNEVRILLTCGRNNCAESVSARPQRDA